MDHCRWVLVEECDHVVQADLQGVVDVFDLSRVLDALLIRRVSSQFLIFVGLLDVVHTLAVLLHNLLERILPHAYQYVVKIYNDVLTNSVQ